MNIQETKTATKQLLKEYYKIETESLPEYKDKLHWNDENKLGFLLGIIHYGQDSHLLELHDLLLTEQFENNDFIDRMFNYYIVLFQSTKYMGDCPVDRNIHDEFEYTKESEHIEFRDKILSRDKLCLFCWESDVDVLYNTHIIKYIPMAYESMSILTKAGLNDEHQGQNGILLCITCHHRFDYLFNYIDVVDDKFVVKVVHETGEPGKTHIDWERNIEFFKRMRTLHQKYSTTNIDNRKAVELNDEIALYFVENDPEIQPNRYALEFHKRACLIWRMAGGLLRSDDSCAGEDDEFYAPLDDFDNGDKTSESCSTLSEST